MGEIIGLGIMLFLALIIFMKTVKIVPQRSAFIVERLGKYAGTLNAGFHVLIPFLDKVSYKHTLQENAIDVPSQLCVTKDNVTVEVDGILYIQVMDPQKASYGIENYRFAVTQLSQTTMRSVIGKLDLDKTFEERESMNSVIVEAVDKASDPWGVKVTRYEVKNIHPPQSVKDAMEKQMRAEREKRAQIAESEGDQQSRINRAEGERQEMVAFSEGEKQKRINEASGKGSEILQIAEATAKGIELVAQAISVKGGQEAVKLQIASDYIKQFGELAKTNNTMIIPQNMTDISAMIATATKVFDATSDNK